MAKYFEVMSGAGMVNQEKVDRYFDETPKSEWLKKENVDIMAAVEHDIKSELFKDLLARSEEYIAVNEDIGLVIKYSIHNALMNLAYSKEEGAEKEFQSLLKEVKSWDFPQKGETLFMVESRMKKREGPKEYMNYCLENVNPNLWNTASELNSVAWYFFEKTEDPKSLMAAEEWAARAVALEPSHHVLDTYANLLFANGKHEKALKIETQALEKARAEGADTESYEAVIAKIKESM
jgi:tetratricopeptide (TPR) repeat protein